MQLTKKILCNEKTCKGQSLIELLLAIAFAGVVLPVLIVAFVSSREGKPQQQQRIQAVTLLKEAVEAVRSIRDQGWSTLSIDGTYHPVATASAWSLSPGIEVANGYNRWITIASVNRDASTGAIVTSGGVPDVSTKKVTANVSWTGQSGSSVSATLFLTRYLGNLNHIETTQAQFASGIPTNVTITNTAGGEITLADNTKAKWCSPSLSTAQINLPDGPPVAVAATASATTTSTPNDVFVATSPTNTNSIKLAYVKVTANTDPPIASLAGKFTLDSAQYSAGTFPSGTGLDNSFITNDVKYYKSSSGKLYVLLATNKPDKEVVVAQINNGTTDAFQDPVNKIYKYWTFFNTRIYQGNSASTPNQDQTPYGSGASSLAVFGSKGYVIAGGFLYVFDLSNIDSKTPSSGLDMVGCRIELDGYDCKASTSKMTKYDAGVTGTTFEPEQNGLSGCSDGGVVEKFGDRDISVVQVGANLYANVAVGTGADPELDIVNVTNIPTSSTTPKITASACGTIASGNSGWRRSGTLDFNSDTSSQETANSVFAKSDGTRAYIASNGGVDADGDGKPDSDQFYIINSSDKTNPLFLSGNPGTGALSGFYNGDSTNIQLFPRRSLTVQNGKRAILVGIDGFPNDSKHPQEYQVLNLDSESSPTYCGGIRDVNGFNSLASVSEVDGDNFVYLISNSNLNQMQVIQGGPDGTYLSSGVFESTPFDAGATVVFNRISSNTTATASSSAQMQVAVADAVSGSCTNAVYQYVGPDGTPASYFPITGGGIPQNDDASGYENPGRCLRYKLFLSTNDNNQTPTVNDVSVNYSP